MNCEFLESDLSASIFWESNQWIEIKNDESKFKKRLKSLNLVSSDEE